MVRSRGYLGSSDEHIAFEATRILGGKVDACTTLASWSGFYRRSFRVATDDLARELLFGT